MIDNIEITAKHIIQILILIIILPRWVDFFIFFFKNPFF